MTATEAFRCSIAARGRADPLIGSAPQARGWLLLDHPGPWRIDAVAGSGIAAPILAALTTAAGRARIRPLLVRRPGRPDPSAPRRWRLVRTGLDPVIGDWSSDEDLHDAISAMAGPQAPAADRLMSTPPDPLLLVCTHGVHDTCCAVSGRPVAAALAERWPESVWECSHVGGDRFAPNVLVLPDGYYYGQLEPQNAVDAVEQHLSGTVALHHLRGMAEYVPPVQAAVAAAHENWGPLPARSITVRSIRIEDPHHGHGSQSFVDLTHADRAARVTVEAVRRAEAQLTCRAVRTTPATEYRVAMFNEHTDPPG